MDRHPDVGRISSVRLGLILARISLRRLGNRFGGVRLFRRPATGKRVGRALKGRPAILFPLFIGIVFCWQALAISGTLLGKLEAALARRAAGVEILRVPASIHDVLRTDARLAQAGIDVDTGGLDRQLDAMLSLVPDGDDIPDRGVILDAYRRHGLIAFEADGKRAPGMLPWQNPIGSGGGWSREYAIVVSVLLCVLLVNVVATGLGPTNQDLGKVEWNFEWLFTFPVSTRALFTARLLDFTLTNFYGWMLFTWFSAALFFRLGMGWMAIPWGLGAALCLNALAAALRLVAETWLRLHLPMAKLKNVQALCSILALATLCVLFIGGLGQTKPDWLFEGGFASAAWQWLMPVTLPALAVRGLPLPLVLGIMLAATVALCAAAVGLARGFARDGLVTSPGVYQGRRGHPPLSGIRAPARGRPLLRGVLRKDLLLLCRDRNLFTGVFIIPVVIIGIQLFMNSSLIEAAMGNSNHAAAVAFGVGAYILLTAGANVMASEGHSLWILYTFPMTLDAILRRKLVVMTLVGLLYAGGTLAVFAAKSASWDWSALPVSVMALLGIVIYAHISGGIGVLGYNPLATEPRHRMRISGIYFYMILAAIYGYGLYAPSPTQKLAAVVLSGFLAYAIWQKVRDQLPYMLDPGERPPPRLTLSFAMTAAFFFYLVRSIAAVAIAAADGGNGQRAGAGAEVLAFAVAGGLVGAGSVVALHLKRIPDWPGAIGLTARPGRGVFRAVGVGLLAGLVSAGVAAVYLRGIAVDPELRVRLDQAGASRAAFGPWWMLALLAIAVAPVCEEFLFRGLLFRALRRTLPVGVSVLASAAIFTVLHPGLWMAPVFVLGIATAVSLEYAGLLIAPLLAHAVYNAAMLWLLR